MRSQGLGGLTTTTAPRKESAAPLCRFQLAPAEIIDTTAETVTEEEDTEEQQAPAEGKRTVGEIYPIPSCPEEAQSMLNTLMSDVAKHGSGAAYSKAMGWGESTVRSRASKLRTVINRGNQAKTATTAA